MGLSDHNVVLNVIVTKAATNLKCYTKVTTSYFSRVFLWFNSFSLSFHHLERESCWRDFEFVSRTGRRVCKTKLLFSFPFSTLHISSYMSGKMLLKLESVNFIMANHTVNRLIQILLFVYFNFSLFSLFFLTAWTFSLSGRVWVF